MTAADRRQEQALARLAEQVRTALQRTWLAPKFSLDPDSPPDGFLWIRTDEEKVYIKLPTASLVLAQSEPTSGGTIEDRSIAGIKLMLNTVTSDEIATDAVRDIELAPAAVTGLALAPLLEASTSADWTAPDTATSPLILRGLSGQTADLLTVYQGTAERLSVTPTQVSAGARLPGAALSVETSDSTQSVLRLRGSGEMFRAEDPVQTPLMTLNQAGDLFIAGALDFSGTSGTSGSLSVAGNLTVEGQTNLLSGLAVSGLAEARNGLEVTGQSIFSGEAFLPTSYAAKIGDAVHLRTTADPNRMALEGVTDIYSAEIQLGTTGPVLAGSSSDIETMYIAGNPVVTGQGSTGGILGSQIALDTLTGGSGPNLGNIAEDTVYGYNIAPSSVTTDELSDSAVGVRNIAKGAVGPDALLFSDLGNLMPDGSFESGTNRVRVAGLASSGSWSFVQDDLAAQHGAWLLSLDTSLGSGTDRSQLLLADLPTSPGAQVWVRVWVRGVSGAETTLDAGMVRVRIFASDGTSRIVNVLCGDLSDGAWHAADARVVFAAGEESYDVLVAADPSVSTGILQFDSVEVRNVVVRSIVADAAIGTAQIENLSVTNALVANASFSKLTSGTIDADEVFLGPSGTIYAGPSGSAGINDARLQLDSTGLRAYDAVGHAVAALLPGDFSLSSGSTGARLELTPTEGLSLFGPAGQQSVSLASDGSFTVTSLATGGRMELDSTGGLRFIAPPTQNLATNPGFVGSSGFTGATTAVTVVDSQEHVFVGEFAVKLTATNLDPLNPATVDVGYGTSVPDTMQPFVSIFVWSNVQAWTQVSVYDSTGGVEHSISAAQFLESNQWSRVWVQTEAKVSDRIRLHAPYSDQALQTRLGDPLWYSGLQVEDNVQSPTPICTGDEAGCVWDGTPHNSSSTRPYDTAVTQMSPTLGTTSSGALVGGSVAASSVFASRIFGSTISGTDIFTSNLDSVNIVTSDLDAVNFTGDSAVVGRLVAGDPVGDRVELSTTGLQSYYKGNLMVDIANTGDALITGEIRTALSGARIEVNADPTQPEIQFHSDTSTFSQAAKLFVGSSSVNSDVPQIGFSGPDPESDKVVFGLSLLDTQVSMSRFSLDTGDNYAACVVYGDSVETTVRPDGVELAAQWSIDRYELNAIVDSTATYYPFLNLDGGHGTFCGFRSDADFFAGWYMFSGAFAEHHLRGTGGTEIRDNDGSSFEDITASAFTTSSSVAVKKDVGAMPGSALAAVRAAPPASFRFINEESTAPMRIGPMLEDLPLWFSRPAPGITTPTAPLAPEWANAPQYSVSDAVWMVMAAVRELDMELDQLRAQLGYPIPGRVTDIARWK